MILTPLLAFLMAGSKGGGGRRERRRGPARARAMAAVGRLLTRTGARLALIQSLVVVLAFAMAGYFSHVAIDRINQNQMRRAVLGEMVSMEVEFHEFGSAHLPKVVAKRSRLWRGFDYRWTSPDGSHGVGALPDAEPSGWSTIHPSGADRYLVFSERMPDGSRISVGQNLASARGENSAVTAALVCSGLLGVSFCLAVSYLFSRGAWRRIEAVVGSAKAVGAGQLDVRAPTRGGDARDDLDELAGAFNSMLDRLEALIAQVRQVSSDIAHDLRTPLTRVRQRLDRLRECPDEEARLEAIGRIEADLDGVLGVFSALLRLAEIEGDGPSAREGPVDLAGVVARMAETYEPDIEASLRPLLVEVEPAVIRGDAQLIAQAIANLLDNALRHTPPGSAIAIRVRRDAGSVILSVTDSGPGVPAQFRDLVLQRCRRLDPSRPGSGSGLGLAIVAAIARRHNARLSLADAGPGLEVALIFPLASED